MDGYYARSIADAIKEIAEALNRQAADAEAQNALTAQALEITKTMQARLADLD